MTTEAAVPIKFSEPPMGEYRPRSPNLSMPQLSPAMVKTVHSIRQRKWGSSPEVKFKDFQCKVRHADRLDTVSDSCEDGMAEESIHQARATFAQEDKLGGTSSPGIIPVGSGVSDGSSLSGQSALSEQRPPPAKSAKDSRIGRLKSKPLFDKMEAVVPSSGAPAGSDWALSPEMESVTLSYQIQNLIEQVDIGVLTTDVFFRSVKGLIEDYIYVDCNIAPYPVYEELPAESQVSSSHIYLDILPNPVNPTKSSLTPPRQMSCSTQHNGRILPRAKTVGSVRSKSRETTPANTQRMPEHVVSDLTRSQSVPSLFTSCVRLQKNLKRSQSSQISLDQDGYSVVKQFRRHESSVSYDSLYPDSPVKHAPPALPPRTYAMHPTISKRPLPLPPRIQKTVPDATTSPPLPPPIPRKQRTHPKVYRQYPSYRSPLVKQPLSEPDEQKHPSTNPFPLEHSSSDRQIPFEVARQIAARASPASLSPSHTHDYEESSSPPGRETQREISGSPEYATASSPPTYKGREMHQQPLGAGSLAEQGGFVRCQSDPSLIEVFSFSPPPNHGHAMHQAPTQNSAMEEDNDGNCDSDSDDESDMVNVSEVVKIYSQLQHRRPDLLGSARLVCRSSSLDDVSSPSSDFAMDSYSQPPPLKSSHSTDFLASRLPEQSAKLYSSSVDNLMEAVITTSEDENIYTLPPDAVVGYVEPLFTQPMQSYFEFLQMANVNHSAQSIHMEGSLTVRPRRGMKKERYFILHKTELRMHALQGGNGTKNAAKGLQKIYHLDKWCQVKVGKVHNSFVLVTEEEEIELLAPSSLEYCQWMEKISHALKSTQTPLTRCQQSRPTIKGSLHVVINGLTFKCCAVIADRHLKLYGSSEDVEPFYTLPLENASMSTEDEVQLPGHQPLYPKPVYDITGATPPIHLHGNDTSLYLLFKSLQEYSEWHFYLCLDSDTEALHCTPLEGTIRKLRRGEPRNDMEGEENFGEGIPLTTMPSPEWAEAAMEMFKHIKVFITTPLMPAVQAQSQQRAGMGYFATFVHNIIEKCLKTRQLRNEFYCQLISLIAKYPEGKMEALQGWLLLAITIPFFIPLKSKFLWYLEQHINKYLDSRFPQVVAFAECCQAKLRRVLANKERICRPSYCELLHLLPQFPKPPCKPIVKDVMISTGNKISISFDSSTTVQEVVSQINQELGLPPSHETGFSLACDWPGLEDAQISLHPLEKVLDVVSSWNDSLTSINGQTCLSRHIEFVYCSRVYFQARAGLEDSKEAFLLAHQVNQEVVNSRIQVDMETAKELSSLMLHMEYGIIDQYKSAVEVLREALWKYFPAKETRRVLDLDRSRHTIDDIISLWSKLQNTSKEECVRLYLQRVRRIPAFGFRYFQVTCRSLSGSSRATIAVGEDCIKVLNYSSSSQCAREFPYHMVGSFGASGADFMLYICDKAMGIKEKMIFGMPQVLVQELTLLIASYMEMFLKTSASQPMRAVTNPGSNSNDLVRVATV